MRFGKLTVLFSREPLLYTGRELVSGFLKSRFGLSGNALVAFRGGAQVKNEDLVDLEDQAEGESIVAKEMLHFLGEFHEVSLAEVVLLQRVWVAKLGELLSRRGEHYGMIERKGNDLYLMNLHRRRKISVSVATSSTTTKLFHLGVNIDPQGAPVAAVGLQHWGIDPEPFAEEVLREFQLEWEGLDHTCAKVRPVL